MTTNLDARFARYSSPALSVFRVIFGLLYAVHGASKLFGWPVGPKVPVGTWPFWWAGLIELVLGLLIAVGLATRIAAFVASGEMAVAYFWQHFPKSFWPIENGGEPAVLFCFGFLLLAALGAGTFSVDARRGVGVGRPVAGRTVAPRRRFGLRR